MSLTKGRRALFVVTILTGSFLLFLVQPMIARIALPRLGGAPAVWNSAMVVYQALLLGGYAYAHALNRLSPRRQAATHLAVLAVAALWLPIGLLGWSLSPSAQPALWVPALLILSIGPLFFAVSAQAPLIQRWFAVASEGEDPYQLYAASNVGSFAGLLAYPLLVEPILTVRDQRWLWSGGYILLVGLVIWCAKRLPQGGSEVLERPAGPPPTRRRRTEWVVLAFVPSGLMLATSTYITTDIVAMPLLWVLPLGLYLASFIIAFAANRALADTLTKVAPVTILLIGGVMIGGFPEMPLFGVAMALLLLFMTSVALHTQMFRLRPEPGRLTGFYLAMSTGGALGGVFAGLIAPLVFDWTWEYPLLILSAGALVPQTYLTNGVRALWHRAGGGAMTATVVVAMLIVFALRIWGPPELVGGTHPGFAFIVIAAVGLATIGARHGYMLVLASALALFGGLDALVTSLDPGKRTRSYFGIYTIGEGVDRRTLAHGTTLHGVELTGSAERERIPTSYYARGSGVGEVMEAAPMLYGDRARIGVVGLGTGTLACYAIPGQQWRFFEIDPAIARIAQDPAKFRFLARCAPHATIVIGDARLSLERSAPATLDVLALDAFSSDSVPMHLLTREAFATYGRVLSPNGLLVVHISNRFLDLEPVVSAAAKAGGWHAVSLLYRPTSSQDAAALSSWIALSRDPAKIAALKARDASWQQLPAHPGLRPWSDNYATILPLLKF